MHGKGEGLARPLFRRERERETQDEKFSTCSMTERLRKTRKVAILQEDWAIEHFTNIIIIISSIHGDSQFCRTHLTFQDRKHELREARSFLPHAKML